MHDVQSVAMHDELLVNDRVSGWFGDGVVTDVACGFIENETAGPADDLVRIMQYDKHNRPRPRFVYRSDIEHNYTAERVVLRSLSLDKARQV